MEFSDLARIAGGYAEARAVQAAVAVKIFEALREPRDAAAVARVAGCDPRATELLLNALASIGLAVKNGSLYSLTDAASAYLLEDSPNYLGGMIRFDAALWSAWGDLEESLRTGKPARVPDSYQNDSRETETFIAAMDSLVRARGDAALLADTLDFTGIDSMIDIGSGPATYPIAFCRKHATLRATIFDLPATLKITERFVGKSGVADRVRLIAGDYRTDEIPGAYRLAFLSNIIHGESAEDNARLMAKVYRALRSGGRIVVKDHVLDDAHVAPPPGAVFSLLMLLTTERGRCYSFNEVKGWLAQAGFGDVHEVKLPSPLTSSLVVGTKP